MKFLRIHKNIYIHVRTCKDVPVFFAKNGKYFINFTKATAYIHGGKIKKMFKCRNYCNSKAKMLHHNKSKNVDFNKMRKYDPQKNPAKHADKEGQMEYAIQI